MDILSNKLFSLLPESFVPLIPLTEFTVQYSVLYLWGIKHFISCYSNKACSAVRNRGPSVLQSHGCDPHCVWCGILRSEQKQASKLEPDEQPNTLKLFWPRNFPRRLLYCGNCMVGGHVAWLVCTFHAIKNVWETDQLTRQREIALKHSRNFLSLRGVRDKLVS